uniref:Protein kinase domain-containing protein n=1 Tax=Macrostomum lignano TaxID=282301 RepID=A0A1I8JPX8_9PLAT
MFRITEVGISAQYERWNPAMCAQARAGGTGLERARVVLLFARLMEEAIAYAAQENLRLAEAPEAVAVADTQYAPENPLLSRLPEPVAGGLRSAAPPLATPFARRVTDWSGIAHPIFRATAGGPVRRGRQLAAPVVPLLITQIQNRRHREAVRGAAARGRADTAFAAFLLPHLILQLVDGWGGRQVSPVPQIREEILAVLKQPGGVGRIKRKHRHRRRPRSYTARRAGRAAEKPVAELDARSLSGSDGVLGGCLRLPSAGAADFCWLGRPSAAAPAPRALRHWSWRTGEQQPPLQRRRRSGQWPRVTAGLRLPRRVGRRGRCVRCLSGGELDYSIPDPPAGELWQLPQALVAYDVAVRSEAGRNDLSLHRGLLQCELNSASLLNARPDWAAELNEVRAEALWKLGQWEPLRALSSPATGELGDPQLGSSCSPGVPASPGKSFISPAAAAGSQLAIGVGRILCSLHERNSAASRGALTDLAANQVPALARPPWSRAATSGPTRPCAACTPWPSSRPAWTIWTTAGRRRTLGALSSRRATDRLLQAWDLRLSLLAPSYTAQDTVISSRLGFARIAAMRPRLAAAPASASWLSSSTLSTSSTASEDASPRLAARRPGPPAAPDSLRPPLRPPGAAQAALLEAEQLPPLPDSRAAAAATVERGSSRDLAARLTADGRWAGRDQALATLESHFRLVGSANEASGDSSRRLQLLRAKYYLHGGQLHGQELSKLFQQAVAAGRAHEACHFHYAQFLDEAADNERGCCGCGWTWQPRWPPTPAVAGDSASQRSSAARKRILEKLNSCLTTQLARVPSYQFYAVFSQLDLIVSVVIAYPPPEPLVAAARCQGADSHVAGSAAGRLHRPRCKKAATDPEVDGAEL